MRGMLRIINRKTCFFVARPTPLYKIVCVLSPLWSRRNCMNEIRQRHPLFTRTLQPTFIWQREYKAFCVQSEPRSREIRFGSLVNREQCDRDNVR